MKYMQVLRDENKDGISKCSNYQSQRVKNGEGMSKKYKSHQCTPKHQGQKSLGKETGMVMHTCKPSTQETAAGRPL